MAGDWLKFEKATLDKPEVFEMAGILKLDADAVVGKLLRVWDWFDTQSRDGHAPVTLISLLNRITGAPGFCEAMARVGWLEIDESKIILPNFERHNGQTAKNRALANNRQQKKRAVRHADSHASNVTDTRSSALPEKRREDTTPLFPLEQGEEDQTRRILPKNWQAMTKEQRKRQRVLANSPMMIAIGKYFGRKPETLWTVAEAVALKELRPPAEEVELLSRYYSLPLDRDQDYRRRDLGTLLNNWAAEVDRAHSHFATSAA